VEVMQSGCIDLVCRRWRQVLHSQEGYPQITSLTLVHKRSNNDRELQLWRVSASSNYN
jgi:hypothetical protein